MPRDLTAAASSSLEQGFSRAYSAVVLVSFVEVIANSIEQSHYLNGWNWFLLFLNTVPVIGMLIWAWKYGSLTFWPYIHGASSMVTMLMWPWIVIDGDALPAEYQPWVWWVIGMAVISVGVTAPIWLGFSFLVTTSVVWFFVDTSYFGGYSDPWVSIQDSVYAFLVGGAVSGLVLMVKQAARQTDLANSAVISSSIQQAQVDAIERERQRIDALVHDRVLNTLVLASKANAVSEQSAVAQMAKDAITSLESAGKEPNDSGEVTLLGLYRALRKAAVRMIPSIEVETTSAGLLELPGYVAEAVTEATIQALDNAARHSNAQNIRLYLGSSRADDLLIKLIDDGIGFKMDRIAKDRIGIKTSISARLEMAGAKAEIITNPGDGTTIVIRWSK